MCVTGLAHEISILATLATSYAWGGAAIPTARTPEHLAQGNQTPGVLPVQRVIGARAEVGPLLTNAE